jgi:hypothetical protein
MPQPDAVQSSFFDSDGPAESNTHKVAQLRANTERLQKQNEFLLSNQRNMTRVQQMIDGGNSVIILLRQESGLCVNSFKQNNSLMT